MSRVLVDAHLHLWRLARTPQPWIDPVAMAAVSRDFWVENLAAELAVHAVTAGVVVQAANDPGETDDLLAAAADPGAPLLGVVGWVDLTADVPAQLDRIAGRPGAERLRAERLGAERLVGVRHLAHLEPDPRWLLRPDVAAGIAAVGRAGLVVDLVVRDHQLPVVTALADAHPDVRFALNHLAKPPLRDRDPAALGVWAGNLHELARRPGVVAKVSGLALEDDWAGWTPDRLRPAVDVALEAFGPDRLMFGSDWPLVRLTRGYGAWHRAYLELTAALGADEQARIDAGTARATYGGRP